MSARGGRIPFQAALIACLVVALPLPILANAGTVLMWIGEYHLVFGNIAIGLFETFLLKRRVTGVKAVWAALTLILANLISMSIGWFMLSKISHWVGIDDYSPSASEYLILNAMLYILLTISSIVIESPFFFILIKGRPVVERFKIAARINLVSAGVIAALYVLFQLLIIYVMTP